MRTSLACSILLLLSSAGCSDSTTADGGTGIDGAPVDGHAGSDGGGMGVDSGGMGVDSGGMGVDSGGMPVDGGGIPVDGGGMPVDGGGMPVDSGGMPVDGGGAPVDAGGTGTCDDGVACTLDGVSAMGVCTHVPSDMLCDAMPGGRCNATTGCSYPTPCTMATAMTDCDDSNPCTRDTCSGFTMTCQHMPAFGATCDDGLACTTGDRCMGTTCVGMAPAMCDDMNACTADSCDASGACTHTNVADGTMCTDGNRCTGARGGFGGGMPDHCIAGTCAPGTATMCMTAGDTCCPATGMCGATPTGC